ncbi:MAG: tryptophan--tRNA ligase [Nanoarchaeota archaeon]
MTKSKITPWEVSGKVDYDKLIKEFGVSHITKEQREYLKSLAEKKGLQEHLFLRRGLFFAQRDLGKVLDAHRAGKPVFLYTGRAPGGSMHIGHLVPFMFTKFLQDILDCNLYIQIPDDEKFLFKKDLDFKKIDEMAESDLLDVAAIGFNPDKTFVFKNKEYIAKMYPLYLETAKRLTFSQARNTFGFTNDSNIGQIAMPAMQIVPTFFEKGYCLIPCGIDQDPYFRLQRDFAEKMGYKKNATILSRFLTALTGPEGKMSASEPDKAILLTDEPSKVKKKVNKYAFSGGRATLEEHKAKGGNTDVDVAYQWLYNLFETDDKRIEELKKGYESGEILSGEMKKLLIEQINLFLGEHNESKKKAKKQLDKMMYSGKLAKEMWNKEFN